MGQYYNIVTNLGIQKIASMVATGQKLNITKMIIGDSNGAYYEPSVQQLHLRNVKHETSINSIKVNTQNSNWLTVEAIIPANVGGFYIREVGLLDGDNDLIAIGKYSETYKPLPSEGTAKELIIRMVIDVDNISSVSLSVNANLSIVTKEDLADLELFVNTNKDDISALKTKTDNTITEANAHKYDVSHVFYSVAGGVANTYTANIAGVVDYYDGLAVCAKIHIASTGASTINVNGLGAKSIIDSLGNPITSGGLKANTPYTLRYNGTVFILQGKGGGGNVTADKLLNGITATGDSGAVVGTMANNGAITITPGATAKTIPVGYHNGSGTVATDASLISANIKSGKSIFGVAGSGTVVDTADAVLDPQYLLTGYSGYDDGIKKAGTLINRTAENYHQPALNPVVSSANGYGLYVQPPKGFYDGSSWVRALESNLVAGNILSGASIFGVAGNATVDSMGGSLSAKGTWARPSANGIVSIPLSFTPTYAYVHASTGGTTRYIAVCIMSNAQGGFYVNAYNYQSYTFNGLTNSLVSNSASGFSSLWTADSTAFFSSTKNMGIRINGNSIELYSNVVGATGSWFAVQI